METVIGSINIEVSYDYTFTFDTENKVKFWLNDELIFDNTINSLKIISKYLEAGIYPFRVQYYMNNDALLLNIIPKNQSSQMGFLDVRTSTLSIFPKEIKISVDRPMKFEFNVDDKGVVKVLPK